MEGHLAFPFFSVRTAEAKEEGFFFSYSARPSPNPLPKGEGVYLSGLGTLDRN